MESIPFVPGGCTTTVIDAQVCRFTLVKYISPDNYSTIEVNGIDSNDSYSINQNSSLELVSIVGMYQDADGNTDSIERFRYTYDCLTDKCNDVENLLQPMIRATKHGHQWSPNKIIELVYNYPVPGTLFSCMWSGDNSLKYCKSAGVLTTGGCYYCIYSLFPEILTEDDRILCRTHCEHQQSELSLGTPTVINKEIVDFENLRQYAFFLSIECNRDQCNSEDNYGEIQYLSRIYFDIQQFLNAFKPTTTTTITININNNSSAISTKQLKRWWWLFVIVIMIVHSY
ncbi:unnamed protein product [Didymodactylos carnosus]|uniref:Uncharacterized protein n=1 Tax=Didymodactylos carnosus TaxID=1234261 RepID=A0A814W2Q7_9BILA|nr:unnamed protein product [Didymodactylos carnosus]CAF1196297.1 unnamed protein product [Didymodactylos carnosus]CAF3717134.1 unnamed protein product [Didymodactylos carnosus]CAF3960685.1 unnamed protein product [Didymodactylos carnosus]